MPQQFINNLETGAVVRGKINDNFTEVYSLATNGLNVPTGSENVGFIQSGTGADPRTVQDKLREAVSVKDFGAVGDGVTDDTAAFLAARDFMQSIAGPFRGGKLYVPRGRYRVNAEWAFTPNSDQVYNTEIIGDGPLATDIDFSGAPVGSDGISFNGQGGSFTVRDLSIRGARRHGIVLAGGTKGGNAFSLFGTLDNVRVQGSGLTGCYLENCFMMRLNKVWSRDNGETGFFLTGFHTSIEASTCWASDNVDAGWRIDGAVYSSFTACGSDRNRWGYRVTNCSCVFNGCGAEDSQLDNWAFETSNAQSIGIFATSQNIYVSLVGCYAIRGSRAGPNASSNFFSCLTADNRPISITTIGNVSRLDTSIAPAVVLNAASGAINLYGWHTMGNDADSAFVNTGGTIHDKYLNVDQITFPSTPVPSSNVNTLDDYKEGSFTPTIVASGGGTGTYANQTGRFTKIGDTVFVQIWINLSGHTGSGTMKVGGLPYTSTNVAGLSGNFTIGSVENIVLPANSTIMARLPWNSTEIELYSFSTAGGGASASPLALDTSFIISLSGFYKVA